MNLKLLFRLVSKVIPQTAMFAWIAIGLPLPAQTGRIYTSDDYSQAANLLNAATISLVDHAVKRATFFGGDRFWYIDSDHGLPTLMVGDAAKRTKSAAYDPVRMAEALHAAGLEDTDAKRILPEKFDLLDDDRSARITISGTRYRCTLGAAYRCSLELEGPAGRQAELNRRFPCRLFSGWKAGGVSPRLEPLGARHRDRCGKATDHRWRQRLRLCDRQCGLDPQRTRHRGMVAGFEDARDLPAGSAQDR